MIFDVDQWVIFDAAEVAVNLRQLVFHLLFVDVVDSSNARQSS